MAIFDIQILPKFISHKIEWQISSCILDLNFTFWKFLEHSAVVTFAKCPAKMPSKNSLRLQVRKHLKVSCEFLLIQLLLVWNLVRLHKGKCTVWNFMNISTCQILREINYVKIGVSKSAILIVSEFCFWLIFTLKQCKNSLNLKCRVSLKMFKNESFLKFLIHKNWFHVKSKW